MEGTRCVPVQPKGGSGSWRIPASGRSPSTSEVSSSGQRGHGRPGLPIGKALREGRQDAAPLELPCPHPQAASLTAWLNPHKSRSVSTRDRDPRRADPPPIPEHPRASFRKRPKRQAVNINPGGWARDWATPSPRSRILRRRRPPVRPVQVGWHEPFPCCPRSGSPCRHGTSRWRATMPAEVLS